MNYNNIQTVDTEEYVQNFLRTLSNFCSKCPLQPRIQYIENLCKVYLEWGKKEEQSISFELDPLQDKKDVIKEIKSKLQESYPIIYKTKVTIPSAEEIEELIKGRMSLSEALEHSKTEYIPKYKIMRVHHNYNEFDCFDVDSRAMYKFRVKLPITAILEELKVHPKDNEYMLDNFTLLYRMDKDKEQG